MPVSIWARHGLNSTSTEEFYEPGYTTCVAPGVHVPGGGYCFGGDRLNSTNAFGGGQFGYNWQGWGGTSFLVLRLISKESPAAMSALSLEFTQAQTL